MNNGELAKVTARHLRQADTMCRLRLAEEHRGSRGNRGATARFEVANRVAADAATAHTEPRAPTRADFPTPSELFPEQQRLYEAAATGYRALFGDRPARRANVDPWETAFPALGVRLVGNPGLALEDDSGSCELRILRLGATATHDDVDHYFLVLRTADWAARLRVVTADLLTLRIDETVVDVEGDLDDAREWLAERVEVIRGRVQDPRPRPGADCNGCPFVAGCPPHRRD